MNKLIGIVSGQALGVYPDARPESPTFGEVHTCTLEVGRQVFVPRGVCNGFQALSDETQDLYCFGTLVGLRTSRKPVSRKPSSVVLRRLGH